MDKLKFFEEEYQPPRSIENEPGPEQRLVDGVLKYDEILEKVSNMNKIFTEIQTMLGHQIEQKIKKLENELAKTEFNQKIQEANSTCTQNSKSDKDLKIQEEVKNQWSFM